jgi:[methyl-Co(III) methanol-specific corrinoid protein]:coenzyme M methyltransferase
MATELNSKQRVLKLFNRQKIDRIPVFSGMGNVTVHGLNKYGWKFADIHTDANKMAKMAASTSQLFGFDCAVVPFDMGVEAEALGCQVNYYSGRDGILYPTISTKVSEKVAEADVRIPPDLTKAGRIPLVMDAIRMLKEEVGDQVAIGAWTLGPHLVAAQIIDMADLSKQMFKKPDMVDKVLDITTDLIISLVGIYRQAGADYITIREMGAGADILSPALFKRLVVPHLQRVFANIESPNVLHICGSTDEIIDLMGLCGADAISVEERNHVAESRKKLGPDAYIFGNIAGYNTMVAGKPADVDRDVKEAIANGVNAVWPGCDVWPEAPKENWEALVEATKKYGKLD